MLTHIQYRLKILFQDTSTLKEISAQGRKPGHEAMLHTGFNQGHMASGYIHILCDTEMYLSHATWSRIVLTQLQHQHQNNVTVRQARLTPENVRVAFKNISCTFINA